MTDRETASVQGEDAISGAELIAAERARQVAEEGWMPDHDDEHSGGELLAAAICYAEHRFGSGWVVPPSWPWELSYWKPREPIDNLIRAGALIAAEIDRLQRARFR